MGSMIRYATWLLALAAVALMGLAAQAYLDAGRIRDVMANGMETTAEVEGGKLGVRQISDGAYQVDLVWRDQAGAPRTAKGLSVVAALGRQLVAGEAGDPPTLLIKYDANAPGRAPVIVRQAALDQEVNARMFSWSAMAAAVCLVAFAVAALIGRRRQRA